LHQDDDDIDDNGLCRHDVHYKEGSPYCLIIQSPKCDYFHYEEVHLLFTGLRAVSVAQP
jgi:hypothetical protein